MKKEKEFLVKYRFINTGSTAHSVVRIPPSEKRAVGEVLAERWAGLLCTSGGLRNIVSIEELKD